MQKGIGQKRRKTKFKEEQVLKYLAAKEYNITEALKGIRENHMDFREARKDKLNKKQKMIEKEIRDYLTTEIDHKTFQ